MSGRPQHVSSISVRSPATAGCAGEGVHRHLRPDACIGSAPAPAAPEQPVGWGRLARGRRPILESPSPRGLARRSLPSLRLNRKYSPTKRMFLQVTGPEGHEQLLRIRGNVFCWAARHSGVVRSSTPPDSTAGHLRAQAGPGSPSCQRGHDPHHQYPEDTNTQRICMRLPEMVSLGGNSRPRPAASTTGTCTTAWLSVSTWT
jgi:hypothetical protein